MCWCSPTTSCGGVRPATCAGAINLGPWGGQTNLPSSVYTGSGLAGHMEGFFLSHKQKHKGPRSIPPMAQPAVPYLWNSLFHTPFHTYGTAPSFHGFGNIFAAFHTPFHRYGNWGVPYPRSIPMAQTPFHRVWHRGAGDNKKQKTPYVTNYVT